MLSPKNTLALILVILLGAMSTGAADESDGRRRLQLQREADEADALVKQWAKDLTATRRAAEQGNVAAQNALGVMYQRGQGVAQDYAEAMRWYRRAADQGDDAAQFNLGGMYDDGEGVTQDYAEAVKWYRRAAEQGNAWAQDNLGAMYASGRGVSTDYVQAHKWFNLAASRKRSGAGRDMSVGNRDSVAKRMTPAQIAEAQRLAREWAPKPEKP